MPFVVSGARKGGRVLAASLALLAVTAAPALAGGTATTTVKNAALNPGNCVVSHALSQPFSLWSDLANYALAPGGDFETGASGWVLSRATVVSGNQPFVIGTNGQASLRLPAGATVTSAPMCIDSTYPHFRLFARNLGQAKTTLKAEVLFLNSKGDIKSTASGNVVAATTAWFPTDSLKIGVVFNTAVADGAAPVAFRFTAAKGSDWRIDDVYVDPYARR
jgi:hypothetical protein